MTIATFDGLVTAMAAEVYPWPFFKSYPTLVIGQYVSMWMMEGNPGKAVTPTSSLAGELCTDATPGALPFTNPTDPVKTYLTNLFVQGGQAGNFTLYDRLWQNSGLSPTTVGNQTINSVALNRPDANGAGAEAWFAVYTVMGAGSTLPTMVYTNPAGTGSRAGTLPGFVTTAAVGRQFQFSLASGDTGVKSIQTYDNVATQTSGNAGLVIRRKISAAVIPGPGCGVSLGPFDTGLPRIYDDASLEIMYMPNVATASIVSGHIKIGQG